MEVPMQPLQNTEVQEQAAYLMQQLQNMDVQEEAVVARLGVLRQQNPDFLTTNLGAVGDERTLLHVAVGRGFAEFVNLVIENERNYVMERDNEGWTPLHVACFHGHANMIPDLFGPDSRGTGHPSLEPNGAGMMPLHVAVASGQTAAVRALLGLNPALILQQTTNGETAYNLLNQNADEIMPIFAAARAWCFLLNAVETVRRWWEMINSDWFKEISGSIIMMCSFLASCCFQLGLNPPGGFWQDPSLIVAGDISRAPTAPSPQLADPPSSESVYDRPKLGMSILYFAKKKNFERFAVYNKYALASALIAMLLLASGLPLKHKGLALLVIFSICMSLYYAMRTYWLGSDLITLQSDDEGFTFVEVVKTRPVINLLLIAVGLMLLLRVSRYLGAFFGSRREYLFQAMLRVSSYLAAFLGSLRENLPRLMAWLKSACVRVWRRCWRAIVQPTDILPVIFRRG